MNKVARLLSAAVLAVVALPVIAAGGTQKISVTVTKNGAKVAGVPCTLTNKFGSWDLTAPGAVTVRSGPDHLIVSCQEDGKISRYSLKPKSSGGWCWNVSKCGGFGFVIDEKSGVGYEYPNKAIVELR